MGVFDENKRGAAVQQFSYSRFWVESTVIMDMSEVVPNYLKLLDAFGIETLDSLLYCCCSHFKSNNTSYNCCNCHKLLRVEKRTLLKDLPTIERCDCFNPQNSLHTDHLLCVQCGGVHRHKKYLPCNLLLYCRNVNFTARTIFGEI